MKNSESNPVTSNSITARIARSLTHSVRFAMRSRVGREIAHRATGIVQQLAAPSAITDNNFFPSGMTDSYRTRYDYDRIKIQSECLRAWRINPLARRIVNLISQFVIGKGVSIETDHKATQKFLDEWFNHPMNRLHSQLKSWKDEGTRTAIYSFYFRSIKSRA